MDKKNLISLVVKRTGQEETLVTEIIDTTLEAIYETLKRQESVSLRNFGTFYIRSKRNSTIFKFNPSQRLRALFGWSSTYKGKL